MNEEKYKLNLSRWSKIRNLTKEEICELGYAGGNRGIYSCNSCGAVRYLQNSHFKTRLTVCDNGCHGRPLSTKILKGVNDIATTHPHLVHYFANPSEATTVSKGSEKVITLKCPHCNHLKEMMCYSFVNRGMNCPFCSDGFSFAEKFVANLLSALGVDFKKEYKIQGYEYRYDFYIPTKNLIIETHGNQHYAKTFETAGGRTLKDEQENDKKKESVATKAGYSYIVLDCRKGTMTHTKESILNSSLKHLFNLEKIDWEIIGQKSEKSIVVEVANRYNKKRATTYELAKEFGLSSTTVSMYLKKAEDAGLCKFEPQHIKKREVVMVKNGEIVRTEESTKKMMREIGYSCVGHLANGRGVNGRGDSHFATTKKLGEIGFYYTDSEEWESVKYNYMNF